MHPTKSAISWGPRQFVKYSFYRVDPAWRRLAPEEREAGKEEFARVVEGFGGRMALRTYSLVGLRGDADILLWQIAHRLEDIQELATRLFGTALGPYLSLPYSYLATTRPSVYVAPHEGPEARVGRVAEETAAPDRSRLQPSDAPYLVVYPFVKTRAWYRLGLPERQQMMDEHIAVGRRYPSVKINTTYSFGLDDQEFVVAFEVQDLADFVELVMELRETAASQYTLRDTPIFTGIAMEVRQALASLGAPGELTSAAPDAGRSGGDAWTRVAALAELPAGSAQVVHLGGEQVALFHYDGRIYALGNRCPHARGPLAEGPLLAAPEGLMVACPRHGSRFDLATGQPLRLPAQAPVPTYRVKVEDGAVYLAAGESPSRRG